MIMVLLFAAALVTGMTVAEMSLRCQSALSKKLKSTMHRGVPDAGIFLANGPIKLFRREVRSRRQEGVEYHFPLLGDLEAMFAKIFAEGIFIVQKQPLVEIGFQFNYQRDLCQENFSVNDDLCLCVDFGDI
jgi:hypothetical protein